MTDLFVGGVGELYQGDLDLGRLAVERLAAEDLGAGVVVEELSYGAVAVAQRLAELAPRRFVLFGTVERGREPGTVERRLVDPPVRDPGEVQRYITDAVTGYVGVELVLEVAHGLGALPAETVVFEVEPASTAPSEHLSPEAELALERLLALVRAEI